MAEKRIYYGASYRGRTFWTAAKRLVGWNVIVLLLERLGIAITGAVRKRVEVLNMERETAYIRMRSVAHSKRRSELRWEAKRLNSLRKRITGSAGYADEEYKEGFDKRAFTVAQLAGGPSPSTRGGEDPHWQSSDIRGPSG